jgi:hypothetical protein
MTSLPIEFPEGFTSLITQGDSVAIGQIIAQKTAPRDEIVNVITALRISRSHAKKTLRKGPGERIKPGDVVAVKKNFFGKEQARIVSQIAGTIIRYERDTGDLVVRIEQEDSELELISPVAGTITLCNNKEIIIETEDAYLSDGVTLGSTGEGTLFILKESFDDNSDNSLYFLDSSAKGKIVLVRNLTRDLVIKGESIGVTGFLGTTISNEDIDYLRQKELPIPVIEITQELVSELHSWENKNIMIEVKSKAIILRE